jgi:hypothetical protein
MLEVDVELEVLGLVFWMALPPQRLPPLLERMADYRAQRSLNDELVSERVRSRSALRAGQQIGHKVSGGNVQNPPWRHHFIPEFYLKRWCLGGTKLVQFSRPYGSTVKPKRLSPRETGFVDQLYSLEGLDPSVAEQLEEGYFRRSTAERPTR